MENNLEVSLSVAVPLGQRQNKRNRAQRALYETSSAARVVVLPERIHLDDKSQQQLD